MTKMMLLLGVTIFFLNCQNDNNTDHISGNFPQAIIDDVSPSISAKEQAVIELTHRKRLHELSEPERIDFIEEITSYLKTRELIEIVKEDCYENKEIENSPNCLEIRAQCAHLIESNVDSNLSEFNQKIPAIKLCLNEQFIHSNLWTENIVSGFGFIVDYITTMHKELDCPASFERTKQIYDRVVERHGGEKAIQDLLMEDIDNLFYPCLHKYIFR